MHILIASSYLPWPLTEGGRVAQYRTLEAMRDTCTFTFVVPCYNAQEMADAQSFAQMLPHVMVEAVPCFGAVPPQSRRAQVRRAAGKILRRILGPPSRHDQSVRKAPEAIPDYPFDPLNPCFVAAIEEQLAKGCDIFQAEFVHMLTLGPLVTGRIRSVFVHHQLHFVYARRFLEAHGKGGAYGQYVTQRMIREEAAYLATFDSIIVFSEVDRDLLKDFCPALEVSVSPFPSRKTRIRLRFHLINL